MPEWKEYTNPLSRDSSNQTLLSSNQIELCTTERIEAWINNCRYDAKVILLLLHVNRLAFVRNTINLSLVFLEQEMTLPTVMQTVISDSWKTN